MEISLNTPALLFPAISLLLLAYTNRFITLANLTRKLHDEYIKGQKNRILVIQIKNLRARINLIRYMQGLGVFSFLLCVVCMYLIYSQNQAAARIIFGLSLVSLGSSLFISLVEIIKSTNAIELELSDVEELEKSNFFKDILHTDEKKND
ncbi:MAG: DUF2721 domain-containing protein [Bacteroidetes bacterium]|jgi:multisubunit Na+/H+ antiporter MnhC subunit|nr:MAG: DUF2721 domain-containing protein [Bacteroidota bacterium]